MKLEFDTNNPILLEAFKRDPLFYEVLQINPEKDPNDAKQLFLELSEKHGKFFVDFMKALSYELKRKSIITDETPTESTSSNWTKDMTKEDSGSMKENLDNAASATFIAQKKWDDKVRKYIENEIYLDDLELVIRQNMSDFKDQLSLVNDNMHTDLLVNHLMVELLNTNQIHEYIFAELNSFDKNNEIYSIFYNSTGFESSIIESTKGNYSDWVLKALGIMSNWCSCVSDKPKFKTIILDRLITRLLQQEANIHESYKMANMYANQVVFTESEKLRNK